MPRKSGFREGIERTIARLKLDGYSEATIRDYSYAMGRMHAELAKLGRPPSPRLLKPRHITALREAFAYSPRFLRTVDLCLRLLGSPLRIPVRVPPPTRRRWLTRDQANLVLDAAKSLGPPWWTLTFLELEMGYRRVSVRRARLSDFSAPLVRVHGKGAGRMEGDYSLFPHPQLAAVIAASVTASPWLIPSASGGMLSESAANRILERVSRESGVSPLSHHDLRRTFGRSLWESGVRLETVSVAMGHHSLDQTIAYLGIRESDLAAAMRKLAAFENRPQLFLSTADRMEGDRAGT